jgi:hypothetical protein
MKTQSAFVRADRTIHFDAKAPIDFHISLIIQPGNPKANHALRFGYSLQHGLLSVLGALLQHRLHAFDDLFNGLMEFFFIRIPGVYGF